MKRFFFFFTSLLVFAFIGCSDSCKKSSDNQTASVNNSCDTSLWKYIYHRNRLQMIKPCFSAIGTIEVIRKEKDGDYHILLKLDAGQDSLLNEKNIEKQKGDLVLEPICVNKVTQEDAIDACKNCPLTVQVPPVHSHVKVTGSYIKDNQHGWMEIHPVTKIEIVQ